MLKRECGAESNGKLLQLRFLSLQWKTCLWAELQPWCLSLQWRTCPWAEHWWWWWWWSKICWTFHAQCRMRCWWPEMLKSVVKPNNNSFCNMLCGTSIATIVRRGLMGHLEQDFYLFLSHLEQDIFNSKLDKHSLSWVLLTTYSCYDPRVLTPSSPPFNGLTVAIPFTSYGTPPCSCQTYLPPVISPLP